MLFFKRKEPVVKKESIETPKKETASLDSIIHERVITATGFTRKALAKAKKVK